MKFILNEMEFKGFFYIKVFYLGERYYGLAKQPNLDTIEERIENALIQTKYLPSNSDNDLKFKYLYYAGRTDKFVNAIGMVFGFFSLKENIYLMEINSKLPKDIIAWAWCKVNDKLDVQNYFEYLSDHQQENKLTKSKHIKLPRYYAIQRIYKYFIFDFDNSINIDHTKMIAQKFIGCKDFKAFSKKDLERNTLRCLEEINIYRNEDKLVIFEFKSKSFLWHQIRKIITAIIKVIKNEWNENDIDKLLNINSLEKVESIEINKIISKLNLANPSQLFLWEIVYPADIKFIVCEKSKKKIIYLLNEFLNEFENRYHILKFIKNNCSFF